MSCNCLKFHLLFFHSVENILYYNVFPLRRKWSTDLVIQIPILIAKPPWKISSWRFWTKTQLFAYTIFYFKKKIIRFVILLSLAYKANITKYHIHTYIPYSRTTVPFRESNSTSISYQLIYVFPILMYKYVQYQVLY